MVVAVGATTITVIVTAVKFSKDQLKKGSIGWLAAALSKIAAHIA